MVSLHTSPRRVWFDVNIGTNPATATALLFALKHPQIEVVGISISGKNQIRRRQEALDILEYADAMDIPVYLEDQVSRSIVDATMPDDTIVLGPLTNISKLVLEETTLGTIHVLGGTFRTVYYRGTTITAEKNIKDDMDSARIVLTQCDDVVISSFDASSQLLLDAKTKEKIEKSHSFLTSRFRGFENFLNEKYGPEYSNLLLCDILPVCDVLNVPTICREVIEFVFQSDGTFFSTTPLDNCPEPIVEIKKGSNNTAMPTVKHQVIRTVNSSRILEELTSII